MTEERTQVLAYAVRGRVVAKYGGQLGLILALLTLPPLGVALVDQNWALAWRFGLICTVLAVTGGLLGRLTAPERIQVNEALSVTALAFLVAALLMSWPMHEAGIAYIDALFESVSGVTTTGLTTLGNIELRSDTFLFTRSWLQWYGGLGFIVLSVALLMGHQAASRRLVGSVEGSATMMVTAHTHALRTLIVYICLTVAGLILLWPLAGDGFTALLYTLSAVSTGGFSAHANSLAGLDSRLTAVAVMLLSLFGAVSLHLYWKVVHDGWRDGFRRLFFDIELRSLLLACLLSGAILSLLAWLNGITNPWYHGFLSGVSAQTTTGFVTLPVAEMDPVSRLVMIFSMLVGGSVGSSAGGIKILRLLILLRLLQLTLRRTMMPEHAVAEPYLGEHKIDADDTSRALQLILLFILIIFVSWIPFVALGYDPLNALFEVVSACGTVGLSTGIVRPELEPVLKAILCFDMLAGRLEIIALLVVLYPRTWIGRREKTA